MDCPWPVACTTHAGVGEKLSPYHKLNGVIGGGGCQGQIPQCPLLDKVLRLLRNSGRIHEMCWRVVGSHVVGGR